MIIKIKETGEKKSLSIIDQKSGIDFTVDFIGNSGALADGRFVYDHEEELYVCSQAEYEWWRDTIVEEENASAYADRLKEEYSDDEEKLALIDEIINDTADGCCEYSCASSIYENLKEAFEERLLIVSDGNCGEEAAAYKKWLEENLPFNVKLKWREKTSGVGDGLFAADGQELHNPYWEMFCNS